MYTEQMYNDSLAHHGILGQKWGVRRYQNPDGTLTAEGRRRYAPRAVDSSVTKQVKRDLANLTEDQWVAKYYNHKAHYMRSVDKYGDPYMNGTLPKIGKKLNARNKMKSDLEKNRMKYFRGKISREDYKNTKSEIKDEYKRRKKTIDAGKPDAFVDKYANEEVKLLLENPKGRNSSRKDLYNETAKSTKKSKAKNVANLFLNPMSLSSGREQNTSYSNYLKEVNSFLKKNPELEPIYNDKTKEISGYRDTKTNKKYSPHIIYGDKRFK